MFVLIRGGIATRSRGVWRDCYRKYSTFEVLYTGCAKKEPGLRSRCKLTLNCTTLAGLDIFCVRLCRPFSS